MDLGLGNLIELKRRLLAATMLTQTTYDATITAIGRGVAGAFDKHCNRQFVRLAGAVDQFSADRMSYTLARFPLETLTTIEQRDDLNAGWVAQTVNDLVVNRDDSAGLLQFGTTLGSHLSQVRVTYTGGYWFDPAETEDTAQPGGSTKLPFDVKEAWYLQCQELWDKRDKLGLSLVAAPEAQSKVAAIEFAPVVQKMLGGHTRYQIT